MGDVNGRICYSKATGGNAGKVAHKSSDGAIIYKVGGSASPASITIQWGDGDKDLDICAYWRGCEEQAIGWSHRMISQSPFFAEWGGDNTSAAGSETISNVKMDPWNYSGTPWFYIKGNFYGESEGAGAATVTVSRGGNTLGSFTFTASKRRGSRAEPGDPGVVIKFNDTGGFESIEAA